METATRTPLWASILLCHPVRYLDAARNHCVASHLFGYWSTPQSVSYLSIQIPFPTKKGDPILANRDSLCLGHLSFPIFKLRPALASISKRIGSQNCGA